MAWLKMRVSLNPLEGLRKKAEETNLRRQEAKKLLQQIYGLGKDLNAISDKTTVTVGTKKYALHEARTVDVLQKMLEQKKAEKDLDLSDTLKNHEKAIQTYVQTHHQEGKSGPFVKETHFVEHAPVARTNARLEFDVRGKLSNALAIAKALWGKRQASVKKAA